MAVEKSEKVTLSNELKDMEAVVKTSNKENIPGRSLAGKKEDLYLESRNYKIQGLRYL